MELLGCDNTRTVLTAFHRRVTEASKVIMQYVAAASGKGQDIDRVKEQLLQSNPVLEGEWGGGVWGVVVAPYRVNNVH